MTPLNLDSCWDEPAYEAAQDTFTERGRLSSRSLRAREYKDVMVDLYRHELPDPMDTTQFKWEVILRFMRTSPGEIKDVQLRMGRVWR